MFPVDAFQNTVGKMANLLNRLGIRFHLTGGITSLAYGEPRMTQDIGVVIDPQAAKANIEQFLSLLRTSDFMFDETAMRTAVASGSQFQLLDSVEILKSRRLSSRDDSRGTAEV